jgi:hypothetical protein
MANPWSEIENEDDDEGRGRFENQAPRFSWNHRPRVGMRFGVKEDLRRYQSLISMET